MPAEQLHGSDVLGVAAGLPLTRAHSASYCAQANLSFLGDEKASSLQAGFDQLGRSGPHRHQGSASRVIYLDYPTYTAECVATLLKSFDNMGSNGARGGIAPAAELADFKRDFCGLLAAIPSEIPPDFGIAPGRHVPLGYTANRSVTARLAARARWHVYKPSRI